jgi:uncharacterized membrane protein YhaH (DUF805 family)
MDFSLYLDPITKHYVDFQGTAGRRAFWMFILFNFIVTIVVAIIASFAHIWALSSLYALAVLLPALGLEVRRVHDIGKSGWWLLIAFVPLLGAIYLIYLFCQPSSAPYAK